MRLVEVDEPRLTTIETWNNLENTPMIEVDEALGYRFSRTFATFQIQLATPEQTSETTSAVSSSGSPVASARSRGG